uniref:Uncharacterized protein n=1 Tax=Eptatretus burgeri TaxID=7764 RepID=A0A8C4N766_EPTBU
MAEEDHRIRVTSRQQLDHVAARCLSDLHGFLDSCPALSAEQRLAAKALDAAFLNDLHENVTVNGKRWHEVQEDQTENENVTLNLLYNEVEEVASKRKRYPKLILRHLVIEMAAERDAMEKYQPIFKPSMPESVNSADEECHSTLMKRLSKMDKEAMDVMQNAASTSDKMKEMSAAMTMFKATRGHLQSTNNPHQ